MKTTQTGPDSLTETLILPPKDAAVNLIQTRPSKVPLSKNCGVILPKLSCQIDRIMAPVSPDNPRKIIYFSL